MARPSEKKNVYSLSKWANVLERIDSIAVTSIAAFVGVMLTVAMSANSIRTNPNGLFTHIYRLSGDLGSGQHFSFVISSNNLPDTTESTEDKYRSKDGTLYGRYKAHRAQLDYTFHSVYSESRVRFQDAIVDSLLENPCVDVSSPRKVSCLDIPEQPWIVFTAGAMGAGKSRTIRLLHHKGLFPLHSFITVDPDQIRQQLPEFDTFVRYNPEHAGYLTRKECGLISEIVILEALNRGQNILVDGTLRDSGWYRRFFESIRHLHPNVRIAIVHVTSPRDSVLIHAKNRAKLTGRVVPQQLLESTLEQVPKSVAALIPLVDFSIEIHNKGTDDNLEIRRPNINWDEFRNVWEPSSRVLVTKEVESSLQVIR